MPHFFVLVQSKVTLLEKLHLGKIQEPCTSAWIKTEKLLSLQMFVIASVTLTPPGSHWGINTDAEPGAEPVPLLWNHLLSWSLNTEWTSVPQTAKFFCK